MLTTASMTREAPLPEPRTLARMLSRIEAEDPAALADAFAAAAAREGSAHIVGLTGPPGVGKSTLTNVLVPRLREKGRTVGVVAVDPSSTRTGGALLGDRVRMLATHRDPGVFVRSMASRGRLGGLATTAPAVAAALAGAGFDMVLIETVGVGQSETDVAQLADTTVVVVAPGAGDMVQALKAGVLETADVFVVNKADQGGGGQTQAQLSQVLEAGEALGHSGWRPPIVQVSALRVEGVDALVEAVDEHAGHLLQSGEQETRSRHRVEWTLQNMAVRAFIRGLEDPHTPQHALLRTLAEQVVAGELSPAVATRTLIEASR